MKNNVNLLLYNFFDALRKNGFSLGIGEYYALLEALQLGFGIDKKNSRLDKEKLLKTCTLLWLKPNQSKHFFNTLFNDYFEKEDFRNEVSNKHDNEPLNQSKHETDNKIDLTNEIKNTSSSSENDTTTEHNSDDLQEKTQPFVKYILGDAKGEMIKLPDEKLKTKRKFSFTNNYFDINKRQFEQICRFLPIKHPVIDTQTIDIEATVDSISKNGIFINPIFKQKEHITNKVLVLIDNGGSMLAFKELSSMFLNALTNAFQEDNHNAVKPYYFYNIPKKQVYLSPSHTDYLSITQIYEQINNNTQIIIISDAGAARGGNSDGRFKATLWFILQLQEYTNKVIWLNPMPKNRWQNTTAERIERIVKMACMTNSNALQAAINSLRGKY